MTLTLYKFSAGSGRHKLRLHVWSTGEGWTGSLTGGERPHVGGVVLAVPRPSLTGTGTSCDVWIIPVPGHLDTEVAVPLAKCLCAGTGETVALSAGIHVDKATADDIALISRLCTELGRIFISKYKEKTPHE